MRRLLPSLPLLFLLACSGAETDERDAPAQGAVLTSATGLHFPVGSTVYVDTGWGHSVILFESPLADEVFCERGELQGRYVEVSLFGGQVDPGTRLSQGDASGRIVQDDSTTWRSTSGHATFAFHGDPAWAVTGSFSVSDSFDSLDGTFEARRCGSRPWFDGGGGANRASGTLGFEVRSAVGARRGHRHQLFLLTPPIGDGSCEALLTQSRLPEDFEALIIEFERTSEESTERFTEGSRMAVARGAISGPLSKLGPYDAHAFTVTVNYLDERVSGTYEAQFLGRNGALESIEGAFDVSLCDLP